MGLIGFPTVSGPAVEAGGDRLSAGDGYAFDASGNTTGDALGRTFVYDAENKQVEVKNSANYTIGLYYYDGDGKRVKKIAYDSNGNETETTIFVYDASGKSIAEYSDVVANSTDAKVNYLTSDHLGSPRINTDQNGTVTARHDYHPFGEEIDGIGGRTTGLHYGYDTLRQQFTGYERDGETDLDFAQARMYLNALGRFNSVDPVKLTSARMFEPQQFNLYAYTINNPLRYIDPDGKDVNLVNDTKEGRRKALLSITANMTANEARNVGVRWNKDSGKNEVYIKDPSKVFKNQSGGYTDLVDRVGNHDLKLNFTFLERGKSTTVEIGGVPTKVTQKALSGASGADVGGFVEPQSDGSYAVVVAEGGYTPGVKGLTASGQETKGTIAFPDFLVTAHELFGETYKYTPAGQKEGLQNNIIDDSNKVIEIENRYRDFHRLSHRSGTDHGYIHTPIVTVNP